MRNRCPRDEDEPAEVHAELEVDVLDVAALDVAADADAGRVDEHVEPAVALDVLCHEPVAVLLAETSAVTANASRAAAAASSRSLLREASVSAKPSSGEHARDRQADAPRASGDERAPCHGRILPHAYSARMATGEVKLSELVTAGGCAAKYAAGRLEELLAGFVPPEAENLLVGLSPADDAAVYKLDDERALVFTVDFFPPVVDDPRDFGAIAAANALNDVFAMGGAPLLALSVAAFPEELPTSMLGEILEEPTRPSAPPARCSPGGTRSATPSRSTARRRRHRASRGVWAKSTATPGDAIFLTKPLGTGLVLHGAKRGSRARPSSRRRCAGCGCSTARRPTLRPFEPSAVTDVTGFGLLGHAHETASRSGVRIVLDAVRCLRYRARSKSRARASRRAAIAAIREFAGEHVGVAGGPRGGRRARVGSADLGRALVSLPEERGAVLQASFDTAEPLPRADRLG